MDCENERIIEDISWLRSTVRSRICGDELKSTVKAYLKSHQALVEMTAKALDEEGVAYEITRNTDLRNLQAVFGGVAAKDHKDLSGREHQSSFDDYLEGLGVKHEKISLL